MTEITKYSIVLLLLVSCRKETATTAQPQQLAAARSNQTSFWYAGADFTNVSGEQGLSANADVVKFNLGSGYMRSWWIAFNFTDTAGLQKWTQWGYATHKSFGNITILQVWQFTGGQRQLDIPITSLNIEPLNYGSKTVFAIYRVAGTTKWRYSRDGVDISEVDLGTTAMSNKAEIKIESQSSSPGKWGQMVNVKNISIQNSDGTWSIIPTAAYGGNFYSDTGLSIWAMAGHNQDSTLSIGELNMGGNGKTIQWSSTLW